MTYRNVTHSYLVERGRVGPLLSHERDQLPLFDAGSRIDAPLRKILLELADAPALRIVIQPRRCSSGGRGVGGLGPWAVV